LNILSGVLRSGFLTNFHAVSGAGTAALRHNAISNIVVSTSSVDPSSP